MIEVIDYKPFKPKDGQVSFLKGFVRIRFDTPWGKLTCNDLQIYSKNGKHWVNFPSRKVEEVDGVKHFAYSRFDTKEEADKFSETVINAVRSWKPAPSHSDIPQPQSSQPSANKGPSRPIGVSSMDPVLGNRQETKEDVPF
jgi:hypothetical protein